MSRDLTEAPVQGLIRKMALPASIGFFFNTMYNVVDTSRDHLLSANKDCPSWARRDLVGHLHCDVVGSDSNRVVCTEGVGSAHVT